MLREKFRIKDRKLGIKLKNQPEGILTPLISQLQLKKFQIRSSYDKDSSVKAEIDEKVYVLEDIYKEELIEEIKKSAETYLMDDEVADIVKFQDKKIIRKINSETHDFESINGFNQLLEEETLKKVVRSYYGSDFTSTFSIFLHYEALPSDFDVSGRNSTQNWHLGLSSGANALRLLVFLTDETDGGPLEIISAEETKELLREYDMSEIKNNPEIVNENADIQKYYMDKGSALLFNPLKQLHRGAEPQEGQKRIVVPFTIVPK